MIVKGHIINVDLDLVDSVDSVNPAGWTGGASSTKCSGSGKGVSTRGNEGKATWYAELAAKLSMLYSRSLAVDRSFSLSSGFRKLDMKEERK